MTPLGKSGVQVTTLGLGGASYGSLNYQVPEIDAIEEMLKENKIRKAYLMPFMSVAGDHVINDLAGNEEDSWKSVLTGAGIECIPVLKGMAEYDVFAKLWVDHLKTVMSHIE